MFFNALTRKRKRDTNLDEDDMDTVVAVHNNMNERAWMDLRKWEECHRGCVPGTSVVDGWSHHEVAFIGCVVLTPLVVLLSVATASAMIRACCASRDALLTCLRRLA